MIAIVSDTATGLPKEMADRYGIDLVSQMVMFGTETLRDGIDISNEVFLQRLKMSKTFPTTSQPPAGDFVAAFKKHLDAGHEVLCITISSLLSGTYNSAETAKKELGSDRASRITLVDSKSVAAGSALIVLEAARMVKAGKSIPEILPRLNQLIAGMHLDLTVDTLEYLVKGGRLSGAQGFIGGLLQMKPLLTIKEGRLVPLERIRTRGKALARLREIVDENVRGKDNPMMSVIHVGIPAEAEALAQELKQKYTLKECLIVDMPPAVAAHAGPGALGIAYYTEN
jgi:DegV family protein with EDD domain